jgi:hypothetical protein
MEQAKRYNGGKLRWSLVDFRSLEPLVRVLEYGAEKYDDDNWKKGLPFKQVCESIMRHLLAFMRGESLDYESGQPHTAHIMANCMFLEYYFTSGLNSKFDDRYENSTYALQRKEDVEGLEQAFEESKEHKSKSTVLREELEDIMVNLDNYPESEEIVEALKGSDYKRMNTVPDLQRLLKEKNEQLAKYNSDVDAYAKLENPYVCNLFNKDE